MNAGRDAIIIVGLILALAFVIALLRSAGDLSSGISISPRSPSIPVLSSGISRGENKSVREKSEAQIERERKNEIDDIEDQIEDAQAEIELIEQEIENIEKFGENSPYKGMVTIAKRSNSLKKTDPDEEYITLKAATKNSTRVNITGWTLESTITKRAYQIPRAVHLPISGTSGSEQPIQLAPGDTAHITSGRSPNGPSFRLNKCAGYFTQFQDFEPTIRDECPDPEEEIFNFYTRDESIFRQNSCLDYIEDIRKCTIVTDPLPLTLTQSCQEAIIEELNYNACVDNHKNDADFYDNEWRIFLKRSSELWRNQREFIKLLDEEGRTVDHYSY